MSRLSDKELDLLGRKPKSPLDLLRDFVTLIKRHEFEHTSERLVYYIDDHVKANELIEAARKVLAK